MAATPGADERRIRQLLRARGVGPDATLPDPPPPADDWWDRIYPETTKQGGKKKAARKPLPPAEQGDEWEDAEPADETTPGAVARRRELRSAWAGFDRRTRWIALNSACAGTGWALGLVPLLHSWITDCGQRNGTTAALCLGGGLTLATAILDGYPRAHAWWTPLTWAFRIPLASAVLALCLYAPGVAQ